MSMKRSLEDADEASSNQPGLTTVFCNPAYSRNLFELVTEGRLKELLEKKIVNLKVRDERGDTLLHRAVASWLKSGSSTADVIKYLISQDASLLEEENDFGQTALCYICSQCDSAVCLAIIAHLLSMYTTAAINASDYQDLTPLHYLMSSEEKLLKCPQYRSLITAPSATRQRKDILSLAKVLLGKGANINAKDRQERDVLTYTLQAITKYSNRNKRIVDFLLNNGAVVKSMTLKTVKIKDFFKYLLKHVDLNAKDEAGWTCLHHVLMNDNNVLFREWKIKLLLQEGALVEDGTNVIDLAREQGCSFDLITYLMQTFPGYDVNTTDTSGATLLLQYGTSAAQNIEMLLKHGANIKATDFKGNTILHNIMTEFSEPSLFQKLINLGAEPLACNDAGENVIQFICRRCMKCDAPSYLYDWLPLFKLVLRVPQFSSTPLPILNTTVLTPLLKYFCAQFEESCKSRVLQLLFYMVRCLEDNISLLTTNTAIPPIFNFEFSNSMLDPVAHLIATLGFFNFTHNIEEFIHFMLTFGFSVKTTGNNSVSALTILLMLHGGHKLDLAQELIANGVSVQSSALEFTLIPNSIHEETTIIRQHTKVSFFIPDALLVTYIKNLGGIIDELHLIDHCWFPPIFLIYFLPKLSSPELLKYWFNKFSVYGVIPCGTEMFLMAKPLLEAAIENFPELFPQDPEFREIYNSLVSALSVNSPASLRELSKHGLRYHLAKLASARGSSLPHMIKLHVPPTLQFLVKQGP